jgi:hypothetical protein
MAILQQVNVKTSNCMQALNTTMSANADLFFQIGAMRLKNEQDKLVAFQRAFEENAEVALRITLYSRDILQGQGERSTPKTMWKWLSNNHSAVLKQNLHQIPLLGYWKDLLDLFNTPLEQDVLALIAKGLSEKNGLTAKWMPRKGEDANKIRKYLNLSPKDYRRTLVDLTKVVETQMCARDWTAINYSHVPSKAAKIYRKAFKKRDESRYAEFLTKVEKGEEKINSKALHPHEIISQYYSSAQDDRTLEAQWKALPNYLEGSVESFLPVCDTSGSMSGLPIQVCIALGIYLSEKNNGPFKDAFITFSTNPQLQVLRGDTLLAKIRQLHVADWGGSTDISKVFTLILRTAIVNNLTQKQMPSNILIMSDMQFNTCSDNSNSSAFAIIKREYETAGYNVPKLVFWNLNASGSFPVSFNQDGVALVSGFSPSIMTQLLKGENLSPEGLMLKTVMSDRYKVIL